MNEAQESAKKLNKETGFNTTAYKFLKHYSHHLHSIEREKILPPYVLALNFLIKEAITPNKKTEVIENELNQIVQETIRAEKGEYLEIRKSESLLAILRLAAQSLLGENNSPIKK